MLAGPVARTGDRVAHGPAEVLDEGSPNDWPGCCRRGRRRRGGEVRAGRERRAGSPQRLTSSARLESHGRHRSSRHQRQTGQARFGSSLQADSQTPGTVNMNSTEARKAWRSAAKEPNDAPCTPRRGGRARVVGAVERPNEPIGARIGAPGVTPGSPASLEGRPKTPEAAERDGGEKINAIESANRSTGIGVCVRGRVISCVWCVLWLLLLSLLREAWLVDGLDYSAS